MLKEILKWVSAGAVGALVIGLQGFIPGLQNAVPGSLDPVIAGIVIALLKRAVDFLVAKIPR